MTTKLTIFLFTCWMSTFSFGQIKLEDLKVDTNITGFHLAANFQGTNVFTKNGPSDIQTINPTAFSFTIAPNMPAETAKQQLEMLLNISVQNEYKISDLVKKDTTLRGNDAYYIFYTETDANTNYKNLVFGSVSVSIL